MRGPARWRWTEGSASEPADFFNARARSVDSHIAPPSQERSHPNWPDGWAILRGRCNRAQAGVSSSFISVSQYRYCPGTERMRWSVVSLRIAVYTL